MPRFCAVSINGLSITMPSPPFAFSAKAQRTREQPISYLIAVAKANPQLISFAAGLVDPLTLPDKEALAITHRLLSDPAKAREVLQYGTTIGHAPLRQELIKHLERLEGKPASTMSIGPDNIVVTTGSQQALYMLADVLLDPGDIVLIESPSYFVYTGALSSFGARILGVPMDSGGMVVEELDKLLHRLESKGELPRVKAIYCQSYFQNPTGLTLAKERRPRLVEIAKKYSKTHRIVIVEDAAYRELRYDGADLPSVKSFDFDNEYVVACYTFDKPFAAGIKTGYAICPPAIAHQLIEQKGNHDFGSANLCQHIVYEAITDGSYREHLSVVHAGYRAKRDAMLAALERYFPSPLGEESQTRGRVRGNLAAAEGQASNTENASVTATVESPPHPNPLPQGRGGQTSPQWTDPDGGLYIWLSLPRGTDTSRTGGMFEAALKEGVLYVPGEYCFTPDDHGNIPQNHMRLCYAVTPIEQIEPGMERLAKVINRA